MIFNIKNFVVAQKMQAVLWSRSRIHPDQNLFAEADPDPDLL
jgi:hypothetical protein